MDTSANYPPYESKLAQCGQFNLPGSIHAGDHYIKDKMPQLSRHSGKQFAVPGRVWGTNQDAMIDKEFKRLSENEVYIDPGMIERKLFPKGKNIVEKAFLPPSNLKVLSKNKGTHEGCFNKIEHVGAPERIPKRTETIGPRNFTVKKPVKGSYGQTGHFIGPSPEFIADPFLMGREVEKRDKIRARERIVKPMNTGGRCTNGLFDNNIYSEEPGPTYRTRRKADLPQFKAFKAPGPPKTGAINTFTYPEYIADPESEKAAAATAQRLADAAARSGPGFKCTGGTTHSWYTKDINPFAAPPRHKPDVELI